MNCSVCGAEHSLAAMYCRACDDKLVGWFGEIPGLLDQLEITITRQDRLTAGSAPTTGTKERPLPFNEKAAEVRNDLLIILDYWARQVLAFDARITPDGPTACRWMLDYMGRVRTHERAARLHHQVRVGVSSALRAIDRPAERVFAGPCMAVMGDIECREDLYARPGAETVRCRLCRSEHDVAARREWMLGQVRNESADAALMASILNQLGFAIHSSTIRRYASEERLEVVGTDSNSTPKYLIGQVIDVFFEKKERRGKKSAPKVLTN